MCIRDRCRAHAAPTLRRGGRYPRNRRRGPYAETPRAAARTGKLDVYKRQVTPYVSEDRQITLEIDRLPLVGLRRDGVLRADVYKRQP